MDTIKKWNGFREGFLMVVLCLLTISVGSSVYDNQLSGTWEGTFITQEFPGNLKLILKSDGEDWSGTLEVSVDTDTASGPLLDIEVDGNNFNALFTATGPEVKIKGTVDGDKMTGFLSVYSEGDLIDEGTFECTREKK